VLHTSLWCVHVVFDTPLVRLRPPIRTRSSLWPLSRSSSLSRACDPFTTNVERKR
jgi:hypothetical protein